MSDLANACKENRDTFVEAMREGDGWIPESCEDLNSSNINVISAMINEYGQAWLVKINLYNGDRKPLVKAILSGDDYNCYNFCCSAVIPAYNAKLEDMILSRDDAPYTGTSSDKVMVDAIIDWIQELGGKYLVWS